MYYLSLNKIKGDILSILKHSKIINARLEDRKNSTPAGLKNRCEVAKRIIETYLGDQESKSFNDKNSSSSSSLSAELVSRLNFNPNQSTKVTFNEDSLNKVIVSSTTSNSDDDYGHKKMKRKFDEDEDDEFDDEIEEQEEKPLEYRGYLKQSPTKVIKLNKSSNRSSISLNEYSKLQNKPVKSRLSLNQSSLDTPFSSVSTSKFVKLNKSSSDLTLSTNNKIFTANLESSLNSIKKTIVNTKTKNNTEQRESVFNRIKISNNQSPSNKILDQLGLIKKSIQSDKPKIIPITFDNKTTTTNTKSTNNPSKVISLNNKNKTQSFGKKSVHERISFN
jgi:hypothetical protein